MDGIPLNSSLFRLESFSSFLRRRINSNTEPFSAEELEQTGGGGGGGGGGRGGAAAAARGVDVRPGGGGTSPGVPGAFWDSTRPKHNVDSLQSLVRIVR